jgi:hypothetical protein
VDPARAPFFWYACSHLPGSWTRELLNIKLSSHGG